MTGIVGVFGPGAAPQLQVAVRAMAAALGASADEPVGTHWAEQCGVHAAWVGRRDGLAGWQSSPRPGRPWHWLFSGECSLAPEALRDAFERQGETAIEELDGSFCGLAIDPGTRRAWLFNDRFGMERLYLHDDGQRVWFASQAKALLAVLPAVRCFDQSGLADFLCYGSVLDGRTLFDGIRLLEGGSVWRLGEQGRALDRHRYFEPSRWEGLPALPDDEFCEQLDALMGPAVASQLQSTQRIGLSLTGGLDTRMILACLPPETRPALAYTYADRQGDTLDVRIAREVAALCGIEHRTLRLDDEFIARFGSHADRAVIDGDGCASILHTHESYLSERAARWAPIRLTGNFGSEILRAMSTFKPAGISAELIDPQQRATLEAAAGRQQERVCHPVTHAAFREIPWHLYAPLAAARPHLVFRTPYLNKAIVELAYRASPQMRTSTLPALRLIGRRSAALADIATDRGVRADDGVLRGWTRRGLSAVSFKLDYWSMEGLPPRLAGLDKALEALSRGHWMAKHKFLPYRRWLRGPLREFLCERVDSARAASLPLLNRPALAALAEPEQWSRSTWLREVNAVLTLEAVDRLMLRAPSSATARQRFVELATA